MPLSFERYCCSIVNKSRRRSKQFRVNAYHIYCFHDKVLRKHRTFLAFVKRVVLDVSMNYSMLLIKYRCRAGFRKFLEVFKCRSKVQNKLQEVISQQKIMVFHTTIPASALERTASLPGSGIAHGLYGCFRLRDWLRWYGFWFVLCPHL